MRRGFSIFFILFFSLGPLAAALDSSSESRLPPCCRRHGAHHCAMAARLAALTAPPQPGSSPAFSAPLTCPYYPGSTAAISTLPHALAASPDGLSVPLPRSHSAALLVSATSNPNCAHAGRGPPAAILS
jgi:hypothetical protein